MTTVAATESFVTAGGALLLALVPLAVVASQSTVAADVGLFMILVAVVWLGAGLWAAWPVGAPLAIHLLAGGYLVSVIGHDGLATSAPAVGACCLAVLELTIWSFETRRAHRVTAGALRRRVQRLIGFTVGGALLGTVVIVAGSGARSADLVSTTIAVLGLLLALGLIATLARRQGLLDRAP